MYMNFQEERHIMNCYWRKKHKKYSFYETYYHDFQDPGLELEVDVDEVIRQTPFICNALSKPNKRQDKNIGPINACNN